MKNWSETQTLFEALHRRLSAGEHAALATVTQIAGSTYRRPGAKLLVTADGVLRGNVSGGCLEQDVRERALHVLATGKAVQVHYDTGDGDDTLWGMGLGCNGQVDIFIHPVTPADLATVIDPACQALADSHVFGLRTTLTGPQTGRLQIDHAATGAAPLTTLTAGEFREQLVPPPMLWICGAGDDAIPLVDLAATAGFRVAVLDHRAAFLTAERFSAARWRQQVQPAEWTLPAMARGPHLAVVKTHNLSHDTTWVKQWLKADAIYIGLLGPRARRDELVRLLRIPPSTTLFGPAGLDIGGEGPEQVALSIIAEVLAAYHQRAGGHLRDRREAIHES